MKKLLLSLTLVLTSMQVLALDRSRSMEEAAFLTDKMTYELGLSALQADDVYQINYDYFTQVGYTMSSNARAADLRMRQLGYVLTPTQYRLCESVSYFLSPVVIQSGRLVFGVYAYYTTGRYYFDRPAVYHSYRGAYRNDINYYQNRRPTGVYYSNGKLHNAPAPVPVQSYRGGTPPAPGRNTPSHTVNNPGNHNQPNSANRPDTHNNGRSGVNNGNTRTSGSVNTQPGAGTSQGTSARGNSGNSDRSSRFSAGGTTRRGR